MRDSRTTESVLTDYAKTLIRCKARQLVRRPGFSRSDTDDLEQEFWLTLVNQAHNFDPDRGSINTFVDRVVNSSIQMVLRDRRRKKRANDFRTCSVDAAPDQNGGSPEPLRASLGESDRCRRIGTVSEDDVRRHDEADAVEHVLGVIPDHLREVCRLVMGGSIASAASELETSRRQIRKALADARPYFERAGFDDL